MRLLVACPQCNRQYDASRLSIGQRFRCHCGSVLTVQQPRGHDAAVVCCSHCGAPRSEGSLKCEYCGADFTLHERDLDTVCPHCLTRVSNHARFCHFCGKPIHPEMVAGIKSTLVCPECGEGHMLVSRAWGDVSALECGRCAGLWLSDVSFQRLTDQAAEEGMHIESRDRMPQARLPETDVPASEGAARYRPCAVCGQLMVRQHFGRQSGVIIDVCKYHGVWFDADELPRILDWIRSGGLARANEEESARQKQEQAAEARKPPMGNILTREVHESYFNSSTASLMALAIGALLRLLLRR